MNKDQKEQFEQSFQAAVQASLCSRGASAELRARLQSALRAESARAPQDLEEQRLERFEAALGQAVAESQEWAPEDGVALRVESAVSQEAGRDLRSERSVLAGDESEVDPRKVRYLKALSTSVKSSQAALVASPQCRARIEAALKEAASSPSSPAASPASVETSKVVPLPISDRPSRRPFWKRALATTASIAAGFALLFVSLLGGADKALADTVRKDHLRCCSALSGSPMRRCASYHNSLYGELPAPPVRAEWVLVASRMCHDGDGGPMIHNVYSRDGKTVSVHFLPPAQGSEPEPDSAPHTIGDGEFPVIAWETAGWTVTACSPDLDLETMIVVIGVKHP